MTPIDGVAAADTLLGYGSIRPGLCLFYVWQAYAAHGARTDRAAGTAYEAWLKSVGRHPGDRNPPPGVPVWFGPKAGSAAGDVVISLGNGRVAATDWPRYGVTGETTIAARQAQIGRPYLGWSECIFDVPIALPDTAGGDAKPFPIPDKSEEDDDMNDRIRYAQDQSTNGSGTIYAIDTLTGTKRPTTRGEWTAIRTADPGVKVAQLPAGDLAGIPNK